MVFSQTSLSTHTVLKVVNLDHLKTEKDQHICGLNRAEARIDGYSSTPSTSPVAHTSFTEEPLKLESSPYSEMFHDSDFEFFQELDPLYYDPAKEEVVQTTDSLKNTEEKALNIDTPHNTFSPQGWEPFVDVNSPLPQTSFYNITPNGPLSPNDNCVQFDYNMFSFRDNNMGELNLNNQEKYFDISNMPVVIGDLASELVTDMDSWQATEQVEWAKPPDTHYNLIYTNTPNTESVINTHDSLDLKFGSVTSENVVINMGDLENVINKEQRFGAIQDSKHRKRSEGLSVDVSARSMAWPGDISTPVILSQVISLEKEATVVLDPPDPGQTRNQPPDVYPLKTSPKVDYEPVTPKSECFAGSDNDDSKLSAGKRRRLDSEDSDLTYTPYSEKPTRKSKRRKNSASIDVIALEKALESQPKARRGRPPKRRESTVSSVCSVDDNSSCASTSNYKYRELRDKNNEASKRSRMNRKLKERQMEILAVELEEKNRKLRAEANVLEELTKKMREKLMSAMLKNK